jgi:AraC-like DNA-binding protein
MSDVIKVQTGYTSIFDVQKLCSIDNEVIASPTKPLIHQAARFLFIKEGKGIIKIQGKEYTLSKGRIAAFVPWEITEVVQVTEAIQYAILKYNYDILNEILKSSFYIGNETIDLFKKITQQHVFACSPAEQAKFSEILTKISEETGIESVDNKGQTKLLSNVYLANLISELLIKMIRISSLDLEEDPEENFDKSEILRYIYLHLSEKTTLESLSKVFYISQSSVRRYIQQMTGMSFYDLINEMRVGKTANYLLYTDFTLEELADILGYVDASHVSKVFSSRIGMKVNEYRKCYQNVQDICKIKENRRAYKIIDYIYRNYDDNITAQQIANEFNISVKELNQLLLYQVEKNFQDFLNFVRINKACGLLLETSMNITEIAFHVGYNNLKTFTRNFLNEKLMKPNEFRSRVQIQERDI